MKKFFYLTSLIFLFNSNISIAKVDLSNAVNEFSSKFKSKKIDSLKSKVASYGNKYHNIVNKIENDIKKIITKFDDIKKKIDDNFHKTKDKIEEFNKIKKDAQKYFKWLVYGLIAFATIFVLSILILISLFISNRKIKKDLIEIKEILQK